MFQVLFIDFMGYLTVGHDSSCKLNLVYGFLAYLLCVRPFKQKGQMGKANFLMTGTCRYTVQHIIVCLGGTDRPGVNTDV